MTPSQPYLIRGLYDWILDNGMTPYLTVDADKDGSSIPRQFVKDGQIVLNVSPQAVRGFMVGNHTVYFKARFNGAPHEVTFPVGAVRAIYARETTHGMIFRQEDTGDTPTPPPEPKKPTLTLVK